MPASDSPNAPRRERAKGRSKKTPVESTSATSSAGPTRGLPVTPDWYAARDKLINDHLGGLAQSVQSDEPFQNTQGRVGRSNVHGVYIGLKRRAGRTTGELAIVVQVLKKVTAHNAIEADALVPSVVKIGHKEYLVDVEQMPRASWQTSNAAFPNREPLARPGSSIGTDNGLVGTLGCFVIVRRDDGNKPCILSNVHVLALRDHLGRLEPKPPSDSQANYAVFQPFKGGPQAVDVADLIDYVEPTFTDQNGNTTWSTDAAIAWTDWDKIAPERGAFHVEDDPDFAPFIGQGVLKLGRTSGLTHGTIVGVGMHRQISYGPDGTQPPFATFSDAVVIQSGVNGQAFSEGGDSGSIILDASSMRPVALLVGGNGVETIANPIRAAVNALKIEAFLNDSNVDRFRP